MTFPLLGQSRDFHPLECAHAGRTQTKAAFPAEKRLGYEIYKRALEHGLLLRPLGDVLYFNPALNITREELAEALRRTKLAMDEVLY